MKGCIILARKTYEQINEIKKELNTTRLWSFSRVNAYIGCNYSYFLKYVKKEKERENSIYGILGGAFHDILEDFYKGKINYDKMIEEAEMAIMNTNMMELKFNKNDEEKNDNIEDKYFTCIKHFFNNHIPIENKVMCEKFIIIKIGNHYFQGYIDAIHKDDYDNFVITDYKSSTIYSGKKIIQEGKQLMLYALGLLQQSEIPLEKIRIRWNFLKYTSIKFMQKNGKEKTMNAERWAWVGKIKSRLRTNLKDDGNYTKDEIEDLLNKSTENNTLEFLPKYIQDLYTVSDCYVYIPLDKETLESFEKELNQKILEIYTKEADYDKNKNDSIWLKEVDQGSFYFCSNICGYTVSQCKCYRKFLETADLFKKDKYKSTNNSSKDEDQGDDWMKQLGLI